MEARANLEAVASNGATALMLAAQEGHDKARAHSGHTHNHWAKGGMVSLMKIEAVVVEILKCPFSVEMCATKKKPKLQS